MGNVHPILGGDYGASSQTLLSTPTPKPVASCLIIVYISRTYVNFMQSVYRIFKGGLCPFRDRTWRKICEKLRGERRITIIDCVLEDKKVC